MFERKGILDSNSHLQMKLKVDDVGGAGAVADKFYAYLPTSTGAPAWIRRAYLTIGGRRVSNLDEVGQYITWTRLHYSNEYKKGVIIPKQGGNDVFVGSGSNQIAPVSATAINARGFAPPFGLLGREGTEFGYVESDTATGTAGTQNASALPQLTKPSQQIKGDANLCPTFMVGLSQLIPFLRGVQLPLFSINQEVALNLEFTPDLEGERYMKVNEAPALGQLTTSFVEQDCLICADYLFYPDLMEGLADEIMNKGG